MQKLTNAQEQLSNIRILLQEMNFKGVRWNDDRSMVFWSVNETLEDGRTMIHTVQVELDAFMIETSMLVEVTYIMELDGDRTKVHSTPYGVMTLTDLITVTANIEDLVRGLYQQAHII